MYYFIFIIKYLLNLKYLHSINLQYNYILFRQYFHINIGIFFVIMLTIIIISKNFNFKHLLIIYLKLKDLMLLIIHLINYKTNQINFIYYYKYYLIYFLIMLIFMFILNFQRSYSLLINYNLKIQIQ